MTAEKTKMVKANPDLIPASSTRNLPIGKEGPLSPTAKTKDKRPRGLRDETFIAPEPSAESTEIKKEE